MGDHKVRDTSEVKRTLLLELEPLYRELQGRVDNLARRVEIEGESLEGYTAQLQLATDYSETLAEVLDPGRVPGRRFLRRRRAKSQLPIALKEISLEAATGAHGLGTEARESLRTYLQAHKDYSRLPEEERQATTAPSFPSDEIRGALTAFRVLEASFTPLDYGK